MFNIIKKKEKMTKLYKRMEKLYKRIYDDKINCKEFCNCATFDKGRLFTSEQGILRIFLYYFKWEDYYLLEVEKPKDTSYERIFELTCGKDFTNIIPSFTESKYNAEEINNMIKELEHFLYSESLTVDNYEEEQIKLLENF